MTATAGAAAAGEASASASTLAGAEAAATSTSSSSSGEGRAASGSTKPDPQLSLVERLLLVEAVQSYHRRSIPTTNHHPLDDAFNTSAVSTHTLTGSGEQLNDSKGEAGDGGSKAEVDWQEIVQLIQSKYQVVTPDPPASDRLSVELLKSTYESLFNGKPADATATDDRKAMVKAEDDVTMTDDKKAPAATNGTSTPHSLTAVSDQLRTERLQELEREIHKATERRKQLEDDIRALTLKINPNAEVKADEQPSTAAAAAASVSADGMSVKLEPIKSASIAMPPPSTPGISSSQSPNVTVPQSPHRSMSQSHSHTPSSPFLGRVSSLGNAVGNYNQPVLSPHATVNPAYPTGAAAAGGQMTNISNMMSPLAIARPSNIVQRAQSVNVHATNNNSTANSTAGAILTTPSPRLRAGSVNEIPTMSPLQSSSSLTINPSSAATPVPDSSPTQQVLQDHPTMADLATSTADDKSKMMRIIEYIEKLSPESDAFNQPVTDADAPGYSEIVKNPMDHQTIHRNVDNSAYPTAYEFHRALKQVYRNAYTYNAKNTVYHLYAQKLDVLTSVLCQLAFPSYAGSLLPNSEVRPKPPKVQTPKVPRMVSEVSSSINYGGTASTPAASPLIGAASTPDSDASTAASRSARKRTRSPSPAANASASPNTAAPSPPTTTSTMSSPVQQTSQVSLTQPAAARPPSPAVTTPAPTAAASARAHPTKDEPKSSPAPPLRVSVKHQPLTTSTVSSPRSNASSPAPSPTPPATTRESRNANTTPAASNRRSQAANASETSSVASSPSPQLLASASPVSGSSAASKAERSVEQRERSKERTMSEKSESRPSLRGDKEKDSEEKQKEVEPPTRATRHKTAAAEAAASTPTPRKRGRIPKKH